MGQSLFLDLRKHEKCLERPLRTSLFRGLSTRGHLGQRFSKATVSGLLQIVDDRANGALLNLRLNKAEVRDVIVLSDAVDALLSAPEIRSYLHREHIQLEDVISSSYFWDKSPEQQSLRAALNPKYSVTFSNVTVREALNTLLLEFPGVWIYSECPGQVSVVAYSTRIPKLWRGFRTGAVKDQSPHP